MLLTVENTQQILNELIEKSGAMTVLIVSKEGYNMVNAGDTSYFNTTALAALVAGMFSATREVATLVGEAQFSILLQQGENRHLHIGLIKDAIMMVIIFENYQRIGKVRLEASKAAEKIAAILNKNDAAPPEQSKELGAPEFKEYALHLIDMIFNSK